MVATRGCSSASRGLRRAVLPRPAPAVLRPAPSAAGGRPAPPAVPRGGGGLARARRAGPTCGAAAEDYGEEGLGPFAEPPGEQQPREAGADVDVWRDTPVRYLGYANEVGEALAAFLPGWGVPFSYAVALSYVLADSVDKAARQRGCFDAASALECSRPWARGKPGLASACVAHDFADAISWQCLASVFIPGSLIHLTVGLATRLAEAGPARDAAEAAAAALRLAPDDLQRAAPTAVGLLAIPFIVEPIDAATHKAMDATVRPALGFLLDAFAGEARGPGAAPAFDAPACGRGAAVLGAVLALPPTLFALGDLAKAGHF